MILFILASLMNFSYAYTLNNNFGAAFKNPNVKVRIVGNTTCENLGLANIYDLQELVAPAANNFWNRIPTSELRVEEDGFTEAIPNINELVLCSPTDNTCIEDTQTAGKDLMPPVDGIVIACNNNFSAPNILAVTVPNKFSGDKILGAVIFINNTINSSFKNLSRSDKIGVIAHEIGHAIGLGHTNQKNALMYYRVTNQRNSLGEDDIRGVSYLYPVKFDGCGLISKTVDKDEIDPASWQLILGLISVYAFFFLIKLLNRPKARAAT